MTARCFCFYTSFQQECCLIAAALMIRIRCFSNDRVRSFDGIFVGIHGVGRFAIHCCSQCRDDGARFGAGRWYDRQHDRSTSDRIKSIADFDGDKDL